MKRLQTGAIAGMFALFIGLTACGGPNDDKGGMDTQNSGGEGAIDSSRLTNFDTSQAALTPKDIHFSHGKKPGKGI